MITSHGTRFVTVGQHARLDVTPACGERGCERFPLHRPRSLTLVRHIDHGRLPARPDRG
jgi:hypothetical protein